MFTENIKRVVTGVLLAAAFVSAIVFLESFLFAIAVGLITATAAWEWCSLGQKPVNGGWDILFILSIGVGVPSLLIFPAAVPWVLGIAVVWWIIAGLLIAINRGRMNGFPWRANKWNALLIIFPAGVAITGLHATGPGGSWYVLACLLIVWTTDTCAYMVGRAWGKRLLAPEISPAKTIEGAGGGLIGASIVGLVLYEILPTEMIFTRFDWVALVIVTSGFSIIGDLSESIYKRAAGVKDSGWILPGHGGILDRIDSTFSSAPVFVAGILFAAT
jgi:phosphatidate cytidylyltransferase